MCILKNNEILSILYCLKILLPVKKIIRFVIHFFCKKYVFHIEGRHKFTKIVYFIPVAKQELDIPGDRVRGGAVNSACLHIVALYHRFVKEYACRVCDAFLGSGEPLEVHVEMPWH